MLDALKDFMISLLKNVYRYVEFHGVLHGAFVMMLFVGFVRFIQLIFYTPEVWEPNVDGHIAVV